MQLNSLLRIQSAATVTAADATARGGYTLGQLAQDERFRLANQCLALSVATVNGGDAALNLKTGAWVSNGPAPAGYRTGLDMSAGLPDADGYALNLETLYLLDIHVSAGAVTIKAIDGNEWAIPSGGGLLGSVRVTSRLLLANPAGWEATQHQLTLAFEGNTAATFFLLGALPAA